jgi:hypothetical protein
MRVYDNQASFYSSAPVAPHDAATAHEAARTGATH